MDEMVQKYKLKADSGAVPMVMDGEDETTLVAILKFTSFLLDHCSNRSIYNSASLLNDLLNATSPYVVSAALLVCGRLAFRVSTLRSGKSIIQPIESEKIFAFATMLPLATDSAGISLAEFISAEAADRIPDGMRDFFIEYFARSRGVRAKEPVPRPSQDVQQTPTRPSRGKSKKDASSLARDEPRPQPEGLTTVTIPARDAKELDFGALLGRVFKQVPADVRFKAVHRAWLVTACAGRDSDAELRLRRELVTIVARAVGYAACSQNDNAFETRVMLKMPEFVDEVGALLAPDAQPAVPAHIQLVALETFDFLCQQGQRIPEFMRALSGSASHGTLMTMIRNLSRDLQTGAELDEEITSQLFSLLMAFAGSPSSRNSLVTAGLTQLLLDVVQIRSPFLRTLADAMELLDCLIIGQPASFQIFSELQGINKLIGVIEREVTAALEDAETEAKVKAESKDNVGPQYVVPADYSLPYRRAQWIRALFVVISNILLHLRTSESINSMVDSPLLTVSKLIITHPETFGNRIVALNFSILCSMLESESSSFQVMHDTKLVDVMVEEFPKLLDLSNSYFPPVCKLINALSSSEGGMAVIEEQSLLKMLISKMSATWTKNDLLPSIGGVFDSLTADHPPLRTAIVGELISYLREVPATIEREVATDASFFSESEPNAGLQDVDHYEEAPAVYKVVGHVVGFFEKFLQNHLTRSEFIKQKGYAPLLDLLFIKGLPYDFAFSAHGISLGRISYLLYQLDIDSSRMEQTLLEHIDTNSQRATAMLSKDWNGQLAELDDWRELCQLIAVLNSLLSVFHETVFVEMGTGYRTLRCMDVLITKYEQIVGRLFEIQRWCVWHEARIASSVAAVVKEATRPIDPNATTGQSSLGFPTEPYGWSGSSAEQQKKAIRAATAKLGDTADSPEVKGLKVFRFVANSLSNGVSSKFGQWAYLCTIERAMATMRKKGLKMADFIAAGVAGHLAYEPVSDFNRDEWRAAKLQALVNLLGILQKVMFKKSPASTAHLGVFAMFKQRNGIGGLMDILGDLWFIHPAEVKRMDKTTYSIYTLAQKSVLVLANLATTRKSLVESSRSIGPLVATSDRNSPDYFSPAHFFVECRIMVLHGMLEAHVWQSSELLCLLDSEVIRSFVDILTKLFTAYPEDATSRLVGKESLPKDMLWEFMTPSEDKVECLVNTGFPESEARKALTACGDDLQAAYESQADALGITAPLDTSALEPRNEPGIAPVSSETGERMVTIGDLNDLRAKVKASLLANALDVIQVHPETVFNFAALVMKAFSTNGGGSRSDRTKESVAAMHQDVVITVLQVLSSFDDEYVERANSVAPIVHFLGLLMQDESFFQNAIQEMSESVGIFMGMVKLPQAHEQTWYPHVLMILEKIVTNIDVPESAERKFDFKFPDLYSAALPRLEPGVESDVYQAVLAQKHFKDDVSALFLARLCVYFSRDHTRATELLQSGLVAGLLTAPRRFPDSPILVKIQTAVLIVLHHAMETPEMVYQTIKNELKPFLESTKVVDATTLVRNHYSLVARSPEIFVDVVSELATLHDPRLESASLCLKDYMEKRRAATLKIISKEEAKVNKMYQQQVESGGESDVKDDEGESKDEDKSKTGEKSEKSDALSAASDTKDEPKDEPKDESTAEPVSTPSHTKPGAEGTVRVTLEQPTGVVHLLLNQLFTLSTDGAFTKLAMTDTEEMKKLKAAQGEYQAKDHPHYIQCCFLLQALAELLGSYNQAKLEFISYAKKAPGGFAATGAQWRPRSYALNYFIHELIPTGSVSPPTNVHACQEWINISTLASNVLVNLMSSTAEKGKRADNDEIQGDPVLMFVRKFALDVIGRAFRDISSMSASLDWRYSVLANLADICWRLLHNRPGMMTTGGSDGVADGATIAKAMYDRKYAIILTGVLSDLDLNFPDAKKVMRVIVRYINKLSRLSMTQKDLDQVGLNEQDIDYDYDDDSDAYDVDDEEQPDIFRNSTLGMFEVDDEDDMYEDDVIEEEMASGEEDIDSDYHYQNVIDDTYSDVDEQQSIEGEGEHDDDVVEDSALEYDLDEEEDDDEMSVQSVSFFFFVLFFFLRAKPEATPVATTSRLKWA